MARLDIEPVPARHAIPEGCSYQPGYGGGAADEQEYVFVPELGDWFLPHNVPAVVPPRCPGTTRKGEPCGAPLTDKGVCVGHSKTVGAALGRILAGEL